MGVTPSKGGTMPRYNLYIVSKESQLPELHIPSDSIPSKRLFDSIQSTFVCAWLSSLESRFDQIEWVPDKHRTDTAETSRNEL